MIAKLRASISAANFLLGLHICSTKMGLIGGFKYTAYLWLCRLWFLVKKNNFGVLRLQESFDKQGWASFHSLNTKKYCDALLAEIKKREGLEKSLFDENGILTKPLISEAGDKVNLLVTELEPFLTQIMGSHVKVFYGRLLKSQHSDVRTGSQIWHADGGPGSCINLLIYLQDTQEQHGAIEIIEFDESKKIFSLETSSFSNFVASKAEKKRPLKPVAKSEARKLRDAWYVKYIRNNDCQIIQPTGASGLCVAFKNNTIHRGGYPGQGLTRYALILHIYPALSQLDSSEIQNNGLEKTSAYPINPAF